MPGARGKKLAPAVRAELDRRVRAGEGTTSLEAAGFARGTIFLTRRRFGKSKKRLHNNPKIVTRVKALRDEENLSPLQTAKQIGICYQTVRHILDDLGYGDWERGPGQLRRGEYSSEEVEALKRLWPSGDRDEIIAACGGRDWDALIHKANSLGLRREKKLLRPEGLPPVISQLRAKREALELTRPQLARIMETTPGEIANLELGHQQPAFRTLERWAAALSCEVAIQEKATADG